MPLVIISMTTIPRRNGTLGDTIASLLAQTYKAHEIRLYLTPGCEPISSVRCIATPDFGPITKLSAVKDEGLPPDAIVVTADDDQIYFSNWLSTLVDAAIRYPHEAVGFSGWDVGHFLRDPEHGNYEWSGLGPCDVLEGFAGVAYRRSFFGQDLWQVPDACRYVDDVWISGYLSRRGIGRRRIGDKLNTSAAADQQGLHTRSDFVELNRKAATISFRGPVTTTTMKLSICIPSLANRKNMLERLLKQLREQPRSSEVEILVEVDDRQHTTGAKRNQLVARAQGGYVVHVDDDDLVTPEYISAILAAIEQNPGVDAILIRGRRRSPNGEVWVFDYGKGGTEGTIIDDVLWRQIGHLCPIRRDLAQKVPYPDVTIGEDLAWIRQIAPLIKSFARAGSEGQVLYLYEYASNEFSSKSKLNHQAIFTSQYAECSGPGSTRTVTRPYRRFLESFIKEHKIKTILDLGCGDMEVMSHVDLGRAKYLGVDVIAERVARNAKNHTGLKFQQGDAREFPLDGFDLVIIKDVLQHWSTEEVKDWLDRFFASTSKMALATNCNYGPSVNTNIETGGWRAVDLTKPPFSVGRLVFRWSLPRGEFIDDKDVVQLQH